MDSKNKNDSLKDIAAILAVENEQAFESKQKLEEVSVFSKELDVLMESNLSEGDDILNALNRIQDENLFDASIFGADFDSLMAELNEDNETNYSVPHIDEIEIGIAGDSFEDLVDSSKEYANRKGIDLSNPYFAGLSQIEINRLNRTLSEKYELSTLDKYDYAFAGVVGMIMGMVDIFLVGSITDGNRNAAGQGLLGKEVDKGYENLVKKYASFEQKLTEPNSEKIYDFTDKREAIKYLENKHKVLYDASTSKSVLEGVVTGINPSNHHLLSLAHDPSLLGLIVGVMDQLSGKATFIDTAGKLVRVVTKNKESKAVLGADGLDKIVKATTNWFGHLMSDVSGTRDSVGRGMGLPAPFYEVTQKLQFGHFDKNGKDMNLAQISEWLYKQGLDLRAVTTQAIPVIIAEVLIRLYWLFKQHFYYGKSWKDSMPIANKENPDLQKMLLTAMAAFETLDLGHAVATKGFSWATLLSVNFVGVVDLAFRSLQVIRSQHKHIQKLNELDKDLQQEWDRIFQTT